jgi:threonine dehydrogenase-like Zn-dependent dehydrogenase
VVSDKVVMKGLTVLGGAGGDVASVDEAARILNEGGFPTGPLLGTVVGLEDVDRAMALLHRDGDEDAVRAVLQHSH